MAKPNVTPMKKSDVISMSKDICECLYIWGCDKETSLKVLMEAVVQTNKAKWEQIIHENNEQAALKN